MHPMLGFLCCYLFCPPSETPYNPLPFFVVDTASPAVGGPLSYLYFNYQHIPPPVGIICIPAA